MKNLINILCTIAICATALFFFDAATAAPGTHSAPRFTKVACEYEDSINCYWDATSTGNGEGHSFYAIPVGDRVCIKYWESKFNRKHGYCTAR